MAAHLCPVALGAGGLIDRSWCFEQMAEVLSGLAPITTEAEMMQPELLLAQEGRVTLRYCPIDAVNTPAGVVIIGITRGCTRCSCPAKPPSGPWRKVPSAKTSCTALLTSAASRER
ncbi:MAG: hypothetical protein QOF30_3633 [Acidimicrobiaceae bacterium]|nr:hypothetical protein [Acidimicrobiaceae bacterium]